MKTKTTILILSWLVTGFSLNNLCAQDSTRIDKKLVQHGQHFIDKDGDGYNDNAPDHDGDGIPNGLDSDWQKLKIEKGKKKRLRFVDLDGDGINDNIQVESDEKKGKNQELNNQKKGSSINSQTKEGEGKGKKKRGDKH